jgi:hypothetical protein
MTLEEFKKDIQFRVESPLCSGDNITVGAELRLNATIQVSTLLTAVGQREAIELAKKSLTRALARRLYESQRAELASAVYDLLKQCRFMGPETVELCEKIVRIATHQPSASLREFMDAERERQFA